MYIHLTKKKTVPGCAVSQEQAEYDLVGARALEYTGLQTVSRASESLLLEL